MFGCGFMVHFAMMGAFRVWSSEFDGYIHTILYRSNALKTRAENKFPFYDVLTHALVA